MIQDTYLTYQFLKRLATPFNKWPAYTSGVINDKGDIIKTVKERTKEQKNSFGKFDLLVLRLKKLMAKVPGGSSKIASYAAALWLVKEHTEYSGYKSDDEILNELNIITEELDINTKYQVMFEEGEGMAPTNSAGSGNIQGIGVGPKGEPGVSPMKAKKYKKANQTGFQYRLAKGIV